MPDGSFHHGNLRAALLEQAELVLRERGVDGLSLRELARSTGVSHGAPRSHFIDRAALLDALAERGFLRLADAIEAASVDAGGDYRSRLRVTAHAGLQFAVEDAAMLDLMFTAKVSDPPEFVRRAAGRLFEAIRAVISAGVAEGAFRERDVDRLVLLWAATVQGASLLVTSRRTTIEQAQAVVDDQIALILSGELGER
jgi:AcrR family transcriptional regulator